MAKELTADEREALCAWVQQLRTRFDGEPPDVPVEDLQWLPAASAFRGLLELPLRFTPTPTPGGPR